MAGKKNKQKQDRPVVRGRTKEDSRTSRGSRRKRQARKIPLPVVSGRYFIAVGFVAILSVLRFDPLNMLFVEKAPKGNDTSTWKVGNEGTVKVSVVTADYNGLSCASEQEVAGSHCAFKSTTQIWPRAPGAPLDDNKATTIQPYRTFPENHLMLIPGLWAQPEVAMRLHREPPEGVLQERLARFYVRCRVKFVGEIKQPQLRWANTQGWMGEAKALVAQPISCEVTDETDS